MEENAFQTVDGTPIPAVTAGEMREIDRVAVDDVGLTLLQMMENAGRNLAGRVLERNPERVAVLAGNGGNGGGGLVCGRHLANRDVSVSVVLDRSSDALDGAVSTQYRVLEGMDVSVTTSDTSDGVARRTPSSIRSSATACRVLLVDGPRTSSTSVTIPRHLPFPSTFHLDSTRQLASVPDCSSSRTRYSPYHFRRRVFAKPRVGSTSGISVSHVSCTNGWVSSTKYRSESPTAWR